MIELTKSAPYDSAFLAIALIYSIAVYRLFRKADHRDPTFKARLERLRLALEQAHRERVAKSRPSPAE